MVRADDRRMGLRQVDPQEWAKQRGMHEVLRAAGWERCSAPLIAPWSDNHCAFAGISVPAGPRLGPRQQLTTASGSTGTFSVRTVGLDFQLVPGQRLRRERLPLAVYAIGEALGTDGTIEHDVLLAEAWSRPEHSATDDLMTVLESSHRQIEHETIHLTPMLRRVRICAWRAAR
ncbi:hypothetical protein [Streptomyces griseoluteus]|uniref:hypothetical protein n=1 Tax=Streptomyces griseoluteus TaxID=29306 RepID=UPI00369D3217